MLGGIEIEIQEEEVQYINEFIDETGAVAGKAANHITTAGLQTLDGVQATTYAHIDLRREVISQEQSDKEE